MNEARRRCGFPGACGLLAVLAGCATGPSNIETYFDTINPIDAAVVAGVVVAAVVLSKNHPDMAWTASVTEAGTDRYRISIARAFWSGAGEGEFSGRFGREAERVAAAHSCRRYKVLSYQERYQSQNLGAQRVVEGVIQCE